MKRFYHNTTTEPMKFRTWVIAQDDITEADFKWLKAFDIPIRIDRPSQDFATASGRSHTVYGKAMYTCDTTTDKQRDMLVLKYGNNAILLSEDIVLPGSISTCTLSDISW
jgi:hypothetical protein